MNRSELRVRIAERAEWQSEGPAYGCWFWTGRTTTTGYGRLTFYGQYWRAHRASWVAFNGPIPEGMVVRHTCDYRSCVNPDHLEIGTQRQNLWDAIERGHARPFGRPMSPRKRPAEVGA